ncbi:UDP-glycosyltransferase 73C10 [Trichinella pseudospiralis]
MDVRKRMQMIETTGQSPLKVTFGEGPPIGMDSREEEVHCWLQRRKIGIQVCSCGFTKLTEKSEMAEKIDAMIREMGNLAKKVEQLD